MTDNTVTTPAPGAALQTSRPFSLSRFALAAAAAIVLNVITYLVASATGASMTVAMQGTTTTVTVLLTIGATAVPLVLAGAVTWYIARRQPGFRTVAQWLGLAVALLSVASALLAATELGTSIALSLMHVIAGIAWFVAVGRGHAS